MVETVKRLIIESVNKEGARFRPSDWIERVSCCVGSFGPDHRLHYDPKVRPGMIDGQKCLVVEETLKTENPAAFDYIMNFVESNSLICRPEN